MKKFFLISGLLLVLFTVAPLSSQEESRTEPVRDISKEISLFEKKFKSINESMNFLNSKNIDHNDIIILYGEAESLLKEIKSNPELKDYDMTLKLLSNRISLLEEKSVERVSLVKRMDFMYNLMVGLGLAVIVLMSSYSIYMYSRRK